MKTEKPDCYQCIHLDVCKIWDIAKKETIAKNLPDFPNKKIPEKCNEKYYYQNRENYKIADYKEILIDKINSYSKEKTYLLMIINDILNLAEKAIKKGVENAKGNEYG